MAFDSYGNGLSGVLGNIFGYGTQSQNAAGQLAAQGVAGPAQVNTAEEEQAEAQQQAMLQQLQGMAAGTGPSAAQSQLSAGLQQGMAAQQAAAAGTRAGQNSVLRQRQAASTGAGMEAGAANQAAQTRAATQQAGIQGAAALTGQIRNQDIQTALANQQGMQAYNQQVGGLYGAEQGQQAQAGMALQGSAMNALGGASGLGSSGGGGGGGGGLGALASAVAKGGVVEHPLHTLLRIMADGGWTYTGEKGPELIAPKKGGQAKIVTKPSLTKMRGDQVVVPLARGSAPYSPGPLPTAPTPPHTRPAPKQVRIDPQALAALMGRIRSAPPQPGVHPLSPQTAPVVASAMRKSGIHAAR